MLTKFFRLLLFPGSFSKYGTPIINRTWQMLVTRGQIQTVQLIATISRHVLARSRIWNSITRVRIVLLILDGTLSGRKLSHSVSAHMLAKFARNSNFFAITFKTVRIIIFLGKKCCLLHLIGFLCWALVFRFFILIFGVSFDQGTSPDSISIFVLILAATSAWTVFKLLLENSFFSVAWSLFCVRILPHERHIWIATDRPQIVNLKERFLSWNSWLQLIHLVRCGRSS